MVWRGTQPETRHRGNPETVTPFVPVRSKNIKGIAYDAGTQTLSIQFNDESVYTYERVPPQVHTELMASESKGGFFHSKIRGQFTYHKQEAHRKQ